MKTPTPHDLLMRLNDGLADGNDAMVILITMNDAGRPVGLRMTTSPMTPATIADVAQFVVEEALRRSPSASPMHDGLAEALAALQTVTGIVEPAPTEPMIGRA